MLLPYVLFVFLYVGSYLLILEFESWMFVKILLAVCMLVGIVV